VGSIIRDESGRFVQVVRPKLWQAACVKRSRDRTDRIGRARKQLKARLATTQWMSELDRRAICELEANGIEWRFVEGWLDALDRRESYLARRFVGQVLQILVDDQVPQRERFEAHNELYRRLIAAGIVD
jgi:hypothetical protein